MLDGWISSGEYGSILTRPDSILARMSRSESSTQATYRFLAVGETTLWLTGLLASWLGGRPQLSGGGYGGPSGARGTRRGRLVGPPPARPVPASAASPSGATSLSAPPVPASAAGRLMRCRIARESVVMSRGDAAAAWRRQAAAACPARRCRRSGRPADGGPPAGRAFLARWSRPGRCAGVRARPHLAPLGCGRMPQIGARTDCNPCKVRLADAGGISVAEVIGSRASLRPRAGPGAGRRQGGRDPGSGPGVGAYGTRPSTVRRAGTATGGREDLGLGRMRGQSGRLEGASWLG